MSFEFEFQKIRIFFTLIRHLDLFLVRRTLKGGIVDEEGNSLDEVLAEHASSTKEQTDATPPKYSPYRRSSARQEPSPVSNSSPVTKQSPVTPSSQPNGNVNSYYDKPTRSSRGSVTARYKHIAS